MKRPALGAALIAAVMLLPALVESRYVLFVCDLAMIYAIVALGLNLLMGYGGQISVGHAAFFGIGAYTSAILSVDFGWSFWTALPAALALSAASGLLLGLPTLRLRGHYLILATLGFGEIVRLVLQNWQQLTKGPTGIVGIPPVRLFGIALQSERQFYYLALGFLAFALVVSVRLARTRMGRELISVRDHELAAELMGVDTVRVKLFAFSTSAAFAGIAGSLYAHMSGSISPDVFTFELSVALLIMVMLGGPGTILGPVIGALVLTALPELLRDFKELYLVFYGIGILLLSIFLPRGLAGLLRRPVASG
jgi:branched-chain amino acid transport system permease protein